MGAELFVTVLAKVHVRNALWRSTLTGSSSLRWLIDIDFAFLKVPGEAVFRSGINRRRLPRTVTLFVDVANYGAHFAEHGQIFTCGDHEDSAT